VTISSTAEKLMTNPKLTPDHLRRKAIIYIRQSTPTQVLYNRESQRRQYGLADYARSLGFEEVATIDDSGPFRLWVGGTPRL
jgi:hypothetical protein